MSGMKPIETWDFVISPWQSQVSLRLVTDSQGRMSVMADAELPQEVKSALEATLPADLDELLNDEQKSSLTADLAKLARLRREAEVQSAAMRMA